MRTSAQPRAFIVAVRAPGLRESAFRSGIEEIRELLLALRYEVAGTITQARPPSPTLFVGAGKLEELRGLVGDRGITLLALNADLRPGQLFRIEKELLRDHPDLRVYDRTRLILEVFSARAQSKEARLQVERAKLEYEVPFVREWIHRMKTGEHPGYLAGGEQRVDVYYEQIKTRMRRINEEIERLRHVRATRRERRRDSGFFLVAIGGYTNAGKSTLMRTITGADVTIEDRVFSTLVPITRRAGTTPVPSWAAPGTGDRVSGRLLLTDTVGFVENLPPPLLTAFHATLEEMTLADVILLVIDASDSVDECARKLGAALRIVQAEWARPEQAVILCLNKCDRLAAGGHVEVRRALVAAHPDHAGRIDAAVPVSAMTGAGMQDLVAALIEGLAGLHYVHRYRVTLPTHAAPPVIAWIHTNTLVIGAVDGPESVTAEVLCKAKIAGLLETRVRQAGGEALAVAPAAGAPPGTTTVA